MTRCLDGSILDFLRNLRAEHPLGLFFVCEVGMVSCIALDADSPALLGHSEHKGPALFGVEISIGQNEQALMLTQFDVLFEVFEDLTSMKLLYLGISSNPGMNNPLLFKLI